ncbi:outer membrane beta-barrel protein [Microbulbifer sp. TRSA002]|uniref:outer membrane beta-barrel protein n=1 Tax=Microbulbifer sp. TRSA002 TaxID=3243382 RepID=UPI0040398906
MKHTTLAAVIALFSSSIYAEEQPFYLKASLGFTQFDTSYLKASLGYTNLDTSDSAYVTKEDLDSTGYGFTLGYRINKYIAIEAGMTDLGRKEQSAYKLIDEDHSDNDGYRHTEYSLSTGYDKTKYKSYSLGTAFTAQLHRHLSASARIGVHQWRKTSSGTASYVWVSRGYNPSGELEGADDFWSSVDWDAEKESSSNPYYGAEISWSIGTWDIGLEHTIFEIEDEKANFTALGIIYSF